MSTQAAMAFELDPGHVQRTFSMGRARRRAGAVLFADLESSSALARRLSTGNYVTLVRRLVRAADQCIVDAGGLVGRHVGDGVVAFLPVESYSTESAAARACLSTARNIRNAIADAALPAGGICPAPWQAGRPLRRAPAGVTPRSGR